MQIFKKFYSRLKNNGLKTTIGYYFSHKKNFACYILIKFTKCLPLTNTIVFECESDMDDNPRAIYEHMINDKRYNKYRFVWIVKNVEFCKKNYAHENTVFINRFDYEPKNQVRLNYYLSTAKYFLFSHPYWFKKIHKKQRVIHTTHGTPFKNREPNQKNIHDTFDLVLCSSEYTKEWFLKFLSCPEEKAFISPHPRLDLLNVKNRKEILSELVEYNPQEKYIICMPTFKQSSRVVDCDTVDKYSLSVVNTKKDFEYLDSFLKKNNIQLLIKLHPLQVTQNLEINNTSNIHYIQNKDLFEKRILLYNLIGCTDGMITDFSSVLFDYILLNKPIAFFTTYFEKYSRGYIMDNPTDYLCGEQINSFDDLICFLENIANNNDIFHEKRKHINSIVNNPPPQNCCETFVNKVFD